MKKFFESLNIETVKEFCARNFKQISFAVFVALGTIFAVLSNYATNQGYGNIFTSHDEHHRTYYHDDRHHRDNSKRQPWTMQKPDPKRSSKTSNSSNRK